jgi:hypothetical protein
MTGEGRRVKVVRVATTHGGAWLLELSCGHRLTVTAAAEPVRDDATCLECELRPESGGAQR